MPVSIVVALTISFVSVLAFWLGRRRAPTPGERSQALRAKSGARQNYYGYYALWWAALPAFAVFMFWSFAQPRFLDARTLAGVEHTVASVDQAQLEAARLGESFEVLRYVSDVAVLAEGAFESGETAELLSDFDAWLDQAFSERPPASRVTATLEIINTLNDSGGVLRAAPPPELGALADRYRGLSDVQRERFRIAVDVWLARERDQLATEQVANTRSDVDSPAAEEVFKPADALVAFARARAALDARLEAAMLFAVIGLSVGGALFSLHRLSPGFHVRAAVERYVVAGLFVSSAIAVLTTAGIVASLLFESLRFFDRVPLDEFLFGLQWSPQTALRAEQYGQSGAFGAVPVFSGTLLIMAVALFVAGPIGLMSAIYLSEYAGKRTRALVVPALEVLSGVPTVVYGFFALLTVGPFIRNIADAIGFSVPTQSAIAAGSVMGIMIIPFISSLSTQVLNAAPQSLRDGAYALGATKAETVKGVLIAAALPGIVGAFLLAISRAIGETMIVVMAAGRAANLTANPFEAVTTVTVQIVSLLTGDQEFDTAKTLSAFALGLLLFLVTLCLNVVALQIVRRFQERYE